VGNAGFLSNRWGLGRRGCSSHVLSVFFLLPFLLSAIPETQFPPNPLFELITYTLLVRYSLLGLSVWSLAKLRSVASYYCIFTYIAYYVRLNWFEK